jgi:hypothetical protein
LEIVDIVLRLLAVSVVHRVMINNVGHQAGDVCFNAPTLAYLMEHCQSLKCLSLVDLEMDENHCRVLGAYSRPDLEIVLTRCRIIDAELSGLADVLEAIRDRSSFIVVLLTTLSSRMGCAKAVA